MKINVLIMFLLSAFAICCIGDNNDQRLAQKSMENGHHLWCKTGSLFTLAFSDIIFKVDVNVSGRIVSFQKNKKEILAQPSVHPFCHGSTFWPGPQSNWGWPPYPVLDGQPYQAVLVGDTLKTESEDDPQSCLRFSKYFIPHPEKKSVEIQYRIKNISNKTIAVDPWEVTRAKSMGLSFFPEGETAPLEKSNLANVKVEDGMVWYFCDTTLFSKNQKIFTTGKEGWLAYTDGDLLFVKVFPDIRQNTSSPGQSEIEIFAHENKKYIELENHGQQEELDPGESLEYNVNWYLVKLPKGLKSKMPNNQLAQFARKTISNVNLFSTPKKSYAFDDWCLAQLAKELGKVGDYDFFMKRSLAYRNVFDPISKFMRGRNSSGLFAEEFDPTFSSYGFYIK